MGRPLGKKTSKSCYKVCYLDVDCNHPVWETHNCCSYNDIQNVLQRNYNVSYTRDIIQNITLKETVKRRITPI